MTAHPPTTIATVDFSNSQQASDYLALMNAYTQDPMGGGKALSDYTRQNLTDQLNKRHDVLALLLYCDDTPVGLLTSFEGFSTFSCKPLLNIHDVFVSAQFRGRGLSLKLLDHVERIAIDREYCKLTLEVLEKNMAAQFVYKRAGFTGYELDPKFGKAVFWEKKLRCG